MSQRQFINSRSSFVSVFTLFFCCTAASATEQDAALVGVKSNYNSEQKEQFSKKYLDLESYLSKVGERVRSADETSRKVSTEDLGDLILWRVWLKRLSASIQKDFTHRASNVQSTNPGAQRVVRKRCSNHTLVESY